MSSPDGLLRCRDRLGAGDTEPVRAIPGQPGVNESQKIMPHITGRAGRRDEMPGRRMAMVLASARAPQAAHTARAAQAARAARAAGGACVIAAAALLAGCAQEALAGPAIQVGTAYVQQPGSADSTNAYLIIYNSGPADRLLSARTSVGGRVVLRGPTATGSATTRSVPDIRIPADQTVHLIPSSYHLLILRPRKMISGHEIMLTLVFARAGAITVPAQVTNPQSGGGSYFLN